MSVSSAVPSHLERYATVGRVLNDSLRGQARTLDEKYAAYAAKPSDYRVDILGALYELRLWVRINGLVDEWVQVVADGFRIADAGSEPVTVDDVQIAKRLGVSSLTDQPTKDQRLDDILNTYQVADDELVDTWLSFLGIDEKRPRTEWQLLQLLSSTEQANFFFNIRGRAHAEAERRYPHSEEPTEYEKNDGPLDAFRHAYWNALMVRQYGSEFAKKLGNAHEALPNNPADREAMDLYNNEVGRRIAEQHPDADFEELADLVQQAVERGDMVVIDRNGELAWSNQVRQGEHGTANDPPRGGGRPAERGHPGEVPSGKRVGSS